jgi:hypothetical protein
MIATDILTRELELAAAVARLIAPRPEMTGGNERDRIIKRGIDMMAIVNQKDLIHVVMRSRIAGHS